jgi:hypothetical protein
MYMPHTALKEITVGTVSKFQRWKLWLILFRFPNPDIFSLLAVQRLFLRHRKNVHNL